MEGSLGSMMRRCSSGIGLLFTESFMDRPGLFFGRVNFGRVNFGRVNFGREGFQLI